MENTRAALLFVILLLASSTLSAQAFFEFPPASPFNKRIVKAPDSAWSYTFLAGGHLYGAHENERSIYPASSLLGNFKRMGANPANFFVALGDIMRSSNDPAMVKATATAFSGLEMPVYNAPGNHDLSNREAYEKAFGVVSNSSFFQYPGSANQVGFFVRDDYFMIIDTEYLLEEGQEEQLFSFIERETTRLQKRIPKPRHLFVFSHRLLWALCNESLLPADDLANEPLSGKVARETACRTVESINALTHTGDVYWFSGDVGTHWSVPLLYGYDDDHKMHVIASGIGDTREDALLKVTVSPEGEVKLGTYPLTSATWNPVESYTMDYWKENPREGGETTNGFGSKVMDVLSGRRYWLGWGMGLVVGILLLVGYRRVVRPKS